MLHLRKSLEFPHLTSKHEVALSPVSTHEDDELIQAIEAEHETTWTLDVAPDAEKLDEFWSGVQEDLESDPTWFKFADDNE